MLTLELGPAVSRPLPGAPGPCAVQVWQDDGGATLAYAWRDDSWDWVAWPGVAAFRFGPAAPGVTAFPDGETGPDVICDVFRRVILPIVLQARGFEALHAGAVLLRPGAVAFCARTRTGKSTLSFHLAARGYPQLADDVVVLDFDERRVRMLPLPFHPRLQPLDPAPDLTLPASPGTDVSPAPIVAPAITSDRDPIPLAALFLLSRSSATDTDPAVQVARVPPVRAFPAVLAHAHCFDLVGRESRSRLLTRYLDLASAVPVFDLTFQPGFDRLPQVLDAVLSSVESLPPWPSFAPSARS